MRIEEITWRHRNDFHYIAACHGCGHRQKYQDGYADQFYCERVVPARHCPKCGVNALGQVAEKPAA